MKEFYVYVIKGKSKSRFNFYTGFSTNLINRIKSHIKQWNKYTKRFKGRIKLIYFEIYSTTKEALKRELKIKSFNPNQKKELSKKKYAIFCDKCGNVMKLKNHEDNSFQCMTCRFWKKIKLRLTDIFEYM